MSHDAGTDSARPPLPAPLAQTRALREFLATERIGALVLVGATVLAVIWANSPWQAGYQQLWSTELGTDLGRWHLDLTLQEWVNEGLMAVFFLVVGLEVKRELLQGELRDRRRATLPAAAALGGMALPAILYALINLGGPGSAGWGIPMATDIAFALGVLALVAPGIPASGRLFLLALAIVDDIGAIVVIAVFYSEDVELQWLAVAAAVVVATLLLRGRVRYRPVYIALGVGLWLAVHNAGVHATIAGVVMGLLAPADPVLSSDDLEDQHEELVDVSTPKSAGATVALARHAVSPLESLEYALHPWTSLVIVPLFALANAGVMLSEQSLKDAVTSRVAVGVVVGLVVGKLVGISGGAWLACRTGIASRPDDLSWRQLHGLSAVGGIGFTVSLFITSLAFDHPVHVTNATVGIFVASALAVLVAAVILRHDRGAGDPPGEDGGGASIVSSPPPAPIV